MNWILKKKDNGLCVKKKIYNLFLIWCVNYFRNWKSYLTWILTVLIYLIINCRLQKNPYARQWQSPAPACRCSLAWLKIDLVQTVRCWDEIDLIKCWLYIVVWCKSYFWDHSRFMPDCWENAESISCWVADSVGTGLLEGVGAGATNARRISSVVAFRTNISSFTIHMLRIQDKSMHHGTNGTR